MADMWLLTLKEAKYVKCGGEFAASFNIVGLVLLKKGKHKRATPK